MKDESAYTNDHLDTLSQNKISELVNSGAISEERVMVYNSYVDRRTRSEKLMRAKDKGQSFSYPSVEWGMLAYAYALEHNTDYNGALWAACVEAGEDVLWLDEVKHKDFKHSKRVVDAHNEHPIQKAMKECGLFDGNALGGSRSVSQLVKRLLIFKDGVTFIEHLSDTVDHLEDSNEGLSLKIDFLRDSNDLLTERVENLEKRVDDLLSCSSAKTKALYWKKQGLSAKEVSDKVGVHVSSVYRWMSDE